MYIIGRSGRPAAGQATLHSGGSSQALRGTGWVLPTGGVFEQYLCRLRRAEDLISWLVVLQKGVASMSQFCD